MIDCIRKSVSESLRLKETFFAAREELIVAVARAICLALESGNKVLLFGNGGSASDAQHMASEWVGRFSRERRPLAAVALTTDTSILTSVANDYGFAQVFVRQLQALGRPGDVAVGISTSGNSPNVCEGAVAARGMGLVTVGLTGSDGGKLGTLVQHHINVPHRTTARVQEVHIMVGHILCELIDGNMKGL
jgi:D-sedoheptulose 7-phosphate isomerase